MIRNVITQSTFNEAVKENITEFEMSPEEALESTITEFKAQGVDLSNIIQTIDMVFGRCPVTELCDQIRETVDRGVVEELSPLLDSAQQLVIDPACKILSGEKNLHELLFKLVKESPSEEIRFKSLDALIALMDGYPDLLNDEGKQYIMSTLTGSGKVELKTRVLKWMTKCCVNHESNRQWFTRHNVVSVLKSNLINEDFESGILLASCELIVAMTADDDIRAVIADVHTRACGFSDALLVPLITYLGRMTDLDAAKGVINALCTIVVRDEYCRVVSDAGGVDSLLHILSNFKFDKVVARRALRLLGNIAGNDDVKAEIVHKGAIPVTVGMINQYLSDPSVMSAAFLLTAKLCLRSVDHAKFFIQEGGLPLLCQAMRVHKSHESVQRIGCQALRNLAARNKEMEKEFKDAAVDDVIASVIEEHKSLKPEADSVLIALGWDAQLTERWTGKYGDKLALN